MRRRNYAIGDWFAVPLREGGFALGVITHANTDGLLVGYFFGPKLLEVPGPGDLPGLKAADALLICRFGHMGLLRRDWPVLGHRDGWDSREWPMPVFGRHEQLTGRSFRVYYSAEDPGKLTNEERSPYADVEQIPSDGLAGSGYVEVVLTNLLR